MIDWKKTVVEEYAKDKFSSEILDGKVRNKNYVVKEGLIMRRNKILLIPNSTVKERILQALRNAPTTRHPGVTKTYQAVRERFTWRGLKCDVLKHVLDCPCCQENKAEHVKLAGLL